MSSVAGRLTSLGHRVTNSSLSGWATGHSSVTCPRASRLRPGSGSGGGSCFGVGVRGPAGRRDQGVNPRVRGAGSCGESLLQAFVRDRPPVFPGLRVSASRRRCRVAARPCAQARTPPRTERGRLPTGPPACRLRRGVARGLRRVVDSGRSSSHSRGLRVLRTFRATDVTSATICSSPWLVFSCP